MMDALRLNKSPRRACQHTFRATDDWLTLSGQEGRRAQARASGAAAETDLHVKRQIDRIAGLGDFDQGWGVRAAIVDELALCSVLTGPSTACINPGIWFVGKRGANPPLPRNCNRRDLSNNATGVNLGRQLSSKTRKSGDRPDPNRWVIPASVGGAGQLSLLVFCDAS